MSSFDLVTTVPSSAYHLLGGCKAAGDYIIAFVGDPEPSDKRFDHEVEKRRK